MDFSAGQVAAVAACGVLVFLGYRQFKFRKVRMRIPDLLTQGAVVVDVRSRPEFATGSSQRSINIPLDELPHQLRKLDRGKPIVLCCASGTRSAMAERMLRQEGFEQVYNAGSWTSLAR